jgi:hypothetical protein
MEYVLLIQSIHRAKEDHFQPLRAAGQFTPRVDHRLIWTPRCRALGANVHVVELFAFFHATEGQAGLWRVGIAPQAKYLCMDAAKQDMTMQSPNRRAQHWVDVHENRLSL